MKDSFSFAKNWDYSWEVFKDDITGEFTRNDDQPLKPADTAHLFYTANCITNVQGGYNIRYCFAGKQNGAITLTLSDGLPAYGSEYYISIQGDSFQFKPKTIYPLYMPGQKISYRVTMQKLTLNATHYNTCDTIMGYIDTEFIETVSVPHKGTKQHTFFLRGYIRTILKE